MTRSQEAMMRGAELDGFDPKWRDVPHYMPNRDAEEILW